MPTIIGGHLDVLAQPFEFVIICGASLGVFIIGNTFAKIKDSGKAIVEAITDKAPKPRDFLDVLVVDSQDAKAAAELRKREESVATPYLHVTPTIMYNNSDRVALARTTFDACRQFTSTLSAAQQA